MPSRIARSEGVWFSIPFAAVEQSLSLPKRQADARERSSLTRSTSMWRLGVGSSTQARPRSSLCGAILLMKSPRLGSETVLLKAFWGWGAAAKTLSACADHQRSDPALFSHIY